jgi:hypothetical protein
METPEVRRRDGPLDLGRPLPTGDAPVNRIEHRLFSYIRTNWRGRPLTSLATIVNLIASTRTRTGLRVRCEIDKGEYPQGRVVTEKEMAAIRLEPSRFHGDWNYTIRPGHRQRAQPHAR